MDTYPLIPAATPADLDHQVKYVPGLSELGYLDPQARRFMKNVYRIMPATTEYTVDTLMRMRAIFNLKATLDAVGTFFTEPFQTEKLKVEDLTAAGGVPVRSYVKARISEAVPAVVFLHGGGFWGGSIAISDQVCRFIARAADVRVFSVGYRLAPENPFPAGLTDAYNAVGWIHQQADALSVTHIGIMGESAGANLAIAVPLLDRQEGTHYIQASAALFPVVYTGKDKPFERSLYDINFYQIQTAEDRKLVAREVEYLYRLSSLLDRIYAGSHDADDPLISPLLASDTQLREMPPTLLITGEFDPLRPQEERLYRKWRAAGGDIQYILYGGVSHAFSNNLKSVQARDALWQAVSFIAAKG